MRACTRSRSISAPTIMNPETLLDVSTDVGVKPISDRARRVMEKYTGDKQAGTATAAEPANVEPVLLSVPLVKKDAPLTHGELKAKKLKEMALARSHRLLSRAFTGWREQDQGEVVVRASSARARVRSVQAVLAAREDMPVSFGGEVDAPSSERSDAAQPATDDAASASLPELEPVWVAKASELTFSPDGRAFCVRYSPDSSLLATGCGDGSVRILQAGSGRLAYNLCHEADAAPGLPTTCIRWTGSRLLLAATAAGTLETWKVGSVPELLHSVIEPENQIYALEHRVAGSGSDLVATAGKDTCVRIYDAARMSLVSTFGTADPELRRYEASTGLAVGHTSRVFSIRFATEDPNLLISGGWDSVVRLWDLRTCKTIRTLHDAHLCGDSLDVSDHSLLVGCFANHRALRVYDLRTAALLSVAPWDAVAAGASGGTKIYAAQFSDAALGLAIAAGVGSVDGTGAVRVFRRQDGDSAMVPIAHALALKGIYGLDMVAASRSPAHGGGSTNPGVRIAITGGDQSVSVFEMPDESTQGIS